LENPGIPFLSFPKLETVHFPYLILSKKGNRNISRSLGNVIRKEIPLENQSPKSDLPKTSTFHKND
jgi:hypothetical protein